MGTFFDAVFQTLLRLNVPLTILCLMAGTVILFLLAILSRKAGILTDIAFKLFAATALSWTVFFIWAKDFEPIIRTLFLLIFDVTGLLAFFKFRHVVNTKSEVAEALQTTQLIKRQTPWVAVVAGLIGVIVLLTFIIQTQDESVKKAADALTQSNKERTKETRKFIANQQTSFDTIAALKADIDRLNSDLDSIKRDGEARTELVKQAAQSANEAARLTKQVKNKIDKVGTGTIIVQPLPDQPTPTVRPDDDKKDHDKSRKSIFQRAKDLFHISTRPTSLSNDPDSPVYEPNPGRMPLVAAPYLVGYPLDSLRAEHNQPAEPDSLFVRKY